MKFAKTIAAGATALGLAAGSAVAVEPELGREEEIVLLEPVTVARVYGIDEDKDGIIDGYLYLEESDTLG